MSILPNSSINPETNRSTDYIYTYLTTDGTRYRLRTYQFIQERNNIRLWQMFWNLPILMAIGHIIELSFEQVPPMSLIFGMGSFGSSILFYWSLVNIKKKEGMIVKLTTGIVTFCLFLAALFSILQVQHLLIPSILFCIGDYLSSLRYLKNINNILGKMLIYLQIIIIGLKVDGYIMKQWPIVFYGFIIGFFIALAISISMTGFLLANFCLFRHRNSFRLSGIAHIIFQSLGFVFMNGIPSSLVLWNVNPLIFPCLLVILSLCNFLFSQSYLKQIILFHCNIEKIKTDCKDVTLAILPKHKFSNQLFFKKNENWYELKNKKDIKKEGYLMELSQKQDSKDCLICLSSQSTVVWMPCGHKCICKSCTFQTLEYSSACILCKETPRSLYVTQVNTPQNQLQEIQCTSETMIGLKQDQKNKKNSKIQNTLQIIQGYEVILS